MDLLQRLRKVEPDGEGERTRWYRNPDGLEAADKIERLRETLSECHEYISQYSKYEMRQYEMKHENNYVEEPNEAMWLSFKIEKLLGKKE